MTNKPTNELKLLPCPFRQFFEELWSDHANGDIQFEDDELLLNVALKYGLAREEIYDPEKHGALDNDDIDSGHSIYLANDIPDSTDQLITALEMARTALESAKDNAEDIRLRLTGNGNTESYVIAGGISSNCDSVITSIDKVLEGK